MGSRPARRPIHDAHDERRGHGETDADHEQRAAARHLAEVHRRTEQHDGDLEQGLRGEGDARRPAVGQRAEAADGHAEEDGEHQRVEDEVPRAHLRQVQRLAKQRDGQRDGDSRRKARDRAILEHAQRLPPNGVCSNRPRRH